MNTSTAVFHEGEIAIQKRLGVAEKMDKFGRKVIRDYMPEQHRQFYQQLPMLFAGFADSNNRVWASVLGSDPGFVRTENDKSLQIGASPFTGDPLADALSAHTSESPLRLGLLGIELATRRRNRLSAQVNQAGDKQFSLDVLQTFGNCPQYIQSRALEPVVRDKNLRATESFSRFDAKLAAIINDADTFFVASSSPTGNQKSNDASQGADVSHRGGRPGFVRVDNDLTLTIPDYLGNNHFNTLGNFEVNPSAGLLFIDFESGDIITMTGKAKVLWDDKSQPHFKGAERLWQFTLELGYVLKAAMPFRFHLQNWSPNAAMTGTWSETENLMRQRALQQSWLTWGIEKTVNESADIKSFYFQTDTGIPPAFKPGQFLNVRVQIDGKSHTRQYSVSSSPLDSFVRISVKRDGLVSTWLHDHLKPGDKIEIKLPQGGFTLDDTSDKPMVLLSAGVGITPMVSMFRHVIQENLRTRSSRRVIMLNTFKQSKDQAFFTEINQMLRESGHDSQAYWLLTAPSAQSKKGVDYSAKGRVSKDVLQAILPIGSYQFYLCGPATFMQDVYDTLIELDVPNSNIFAEAFGPASLKRVQLPDVENKEATTHSADHAVVQFSESKVEQSWDKNDGNLLDFAEAHGMTPEFSCRNGSCGTCKVRVAKGRVTHAATATFPVTEEEALLCCAMPAKTKGEEIPVLVIDA